MRSQGQPLSQPRPAHMRVLRWHGADHSITMAENWACPGCGEKLRPSDVELDGMTITMDCNRCHALPLTIELRGDVVIMDEGGAL